jgi:hypothetical protein
MTWVFSEDIVSQMTANNAPSPYVASASIEASSHYAYFAFDDAVGIDHKWLANGTSGWLKIDLGSGNGKAVKQYTIQDFNEAESKCMRMPRDWTLQGSNNDSDWTTIDTQADIAFLLNEKKTFTCTSNKTAYRYYKLNITDNNDDPDHVGVGELELMTGKNISGGILNWWFIKESIDKGKKYFKNRGLWLPESVTI